MTVDAEPRVVAIGLDAAEWSLVEPMMAAGELPHLAALRQRAAVARLEHTDYRTGLVWEHFLTGRGAAGSGRWSVVEFDPSSYETRKEGAKPLRPFFADVPGRTICFDVPYVSLASTGDTVAVTAWGGHDPAYPRASRPAGLLREIEARFGPHPAFDNDYEIVWNRPAALEALADALVVGSRRRADVALWLLQQFPDWRLFVTVLSEPHSAGEALWHGIALDYPVNAAVDPLPAGRRLREVYRAVDDAVGRIIAGLPPDTTVVAFSLHGAGTNDADVASMVLLPELLHRLALGRPLLQGPDPEAWAQAGFPIVVPSPDQPWYEYMRLQYPLPRVSRGARARARIGGLVARATERTSHDGPSSRLGALGIPIVEETEATPDEIGVPIGMLDWQTTNRYQPAWPDMRAFALPTFYDGRVRINLEGREQRGVVRREDYEQACRDVEQAVRDCRDPRTKEPVLADVIRLRADDPLASGGADADMQIIWSHAVDAVEHPQAGTIGPVPFRRTGGHRAGGFAFVAGPGISPGELGLHDALAVPATVAALAGAQATGFEARPLPLVASG